MSDFPPTLKEREAYTEGRRAGYLSGYDQGCLDGKEDGFAAERDSIVALLDKPSDEMIEFCARNVFGLEDNESHGSDDWSELLEDGKDDYREFARCVCRASAVFMGREASHHKSSAEEIERGDDHWPEFIKRSRDHNAAKDAVVAAANYVADMTCIDQNGEWTLKAGYNPQIVLDALSRLDDAPSKEDEG